MQERGAGSRREIQYRERAAPCNKEKSKNAEWPLRKGEEALRLHKWKIAAGLELRDLMDTSSPHGHGLSHADLQIGGCGTSSGRKRKRTVQTIEEATARAMMEVAGKTVEECEELPYSPASQELRDRVAALGVTLADDASRLNASSRFFAGAL